LTEALVSSGGFSAALAYDDAFATSARSVTPSPSYDDNLLVAFGSNDQTAQPRFDTAPRMESESESEETRQSLLVIEFKRATSECIRTCAVDEVPTAHSALKVFDQMLRPRFEGEPIFDEEPNDSIAEFISDSRHDFGLQQIATVLASLGSNEMSSSTTLLTNSTSVAKWLGAIILPLYDDDRYVVPNYRGFILPLFRAEQAKEEEDSSAEEAMAAMGAAASPPPSLFTAGHLMSSSFARPQSQVEAVGSSESELVTHPSVHDDFIALISFSTEIDAMAQDVTDEITTTMEQPTSLGREMVLVTALPPIGCTSWLSKSSDYDSGDALLRMVDVYKSRNPKTSDEEEMLENIFDYRCCVLMPLEFQAEVSKPMDIIINSLCNNKDIYVRELIANASV
jgi:hypothetical protein